MRLCIRVMVKDFSWVVNPVFELKCFTDEIKVVNLFSFQLVS